MDVSSSAPSSATGRLLLGPGSVVADRYEILGLLGRGAAGTVWEARHRVLASRVALKMLDALAQSDPLQARELLERFRFEAQISARLAAVTSHIVAAHDAGSFEGVPFLVMELAPGDSLDLRLERGPLQADEVVVIVEQIGRALDAAHEAGIAHRDVKPANVLCVRDEKTGVPRYKLGDFGVAKLFGDAPREDLALPTQTATNMLVGTPAYMSPEYLAGTAPIDGTGDRWALAAMAYELLTGALPFDGETWTIVAIAISKGEFAPPSERLGRVMPAVDAFFARALSLDPSRRFSTSGALAAALAEALGAALAGPSAPLAGPPRVQPRPEEVSQLGFEAEFAPPPPAPRRKRAAILAGLLALLMLAGLTALLLRTKPPSPPGGEPAVASSGEPVARQSSLPVSAPSAVTPEPASTSTPPAGPRVGRPAAAAAAPTAAPSPAVTQEAVASSEPAAPPPATTAAPAVRRPLAKEEVF